MRFSSALVLIFFCFVLSAQNDTTVFKVMQKVETTEYTFSVPKKWKNVPLVDLSSKDRKFEFTDIGLPHEVNYTPVTAFFTLRKYECASINSAEDYIVNEFTSYPDRVTPSGKNYERDSLTVESGEKGTLFSTHYFRRSKLSNFSCYDLIVYSKKRKTAYMLTVTYQYKDPTYALETDLKFKDYALRVFKTLLLR